MLLRLNDIVGRGHELGFSLAFDAQDADVVTVADIGLANGLVDPFRKRRNLVDGVFLRQFNVVKYVVGAVADRHLFCNVTVRIDDLIRAVSEKELGVNVAVRLADDTAAAQLLYKAGDLQTALEIRSDTDETDVEVGDSQAS